MNGSLEKLIKYKNACSKAKIYATENHIKYAYISVKEYKDKWLFTFVPEGNRYTVNPEIFIYKSDGIVEYAHSPVPTLSNLEIYRKGKDIEFIDI